MLKGLDMAVYRSLKRIVGDAEVVAMLDSREYNEYAFGYQPEEDEEKEEKYCYSDDSDGPPPKDVQDHLTKRAFVSRRPFPAQLHETMLCEEPLNPAKIVSNEKDKKKEKVFYRKTVTWLNGSPKSFKDLAVAYLAE
jgi:hypothetical protein